MNRNVNPKIRIRLESFNKELLGNYCQKIIDIIFKNNIYDLSLVSLPTRKKIYCVLCSPHVDKDSREHFELRRYSKLLEIELYFDQNFSIFQLIKDSELPSGIVYQIYVT